MRELQFLEKLLPEVGAFALGHYRSRESLVYGEQKGVADLVTEADTAAQQKIEAAIQKAFPGDFLVGEESGRDTPPADSDARCWVCDPIDGTHNFARGMVPCWGVSLAFLQGGEPRAAGVALPGLGDLFLAGDDGPALRNGKPIRVSTQSDLSESRVEIDFGRPGDRASCLAVGRFVMENCGQPRCHGSAVVGLCTVASGGAEAFVHGGMQPWDFAAAMLIIRRAGGKVTRLDGVDARVFDGKRGMVASNGVVHQTIMDGIAASARSD